MEKDEAQIQLLRGQGGDQQLKCFPLMVHTLPPSLSLPSYSLLAAGGGGHGAAKVAGGPGWTILKGLGYLFCGPDGTCGLGDWLWYCSRLLDL